MVRLTVRVVDDVLCHEEEFLVKGMDSQQVHFPRSAWNLLLRIEEEYGFFSRVSQHIDFKCAKCESFSISCQDLLYGIVPDPGLVLDLELMPSSLNEDEESAFHEYIWGLLDFITAERPFSAEEEKRCLNEGFPEKRLIYQKNGDLIFRADGYPLGLEYDDVFWQLNPKCESCRNLFLK